MAAVAEGGYQGFYEGGGGGGGAVVVRQLRPWLADEFLELGVAYQDVHFGIGELGIEAREKNKRGRREDGTGAERNAEAVAAEGLQAGTLAAGEVSRNVVL